jgi:hypothetical protein
MGVSNKTGRLPAILALALIVSIPGVAAAKNAFTVTLTSGASFESLRQPQEAPWDKSVLLVLTDAGNWIAMPKTDVEVITAAIEKSGLANVIDSKTVRIGRIDDGEEEEEEGTGTPGEGAGSDSLSQLQSFFSELQEASNESRPVYNTEQFVNPEDAGGTAGFPAEFAIEP